MRTVCHKQKRTGAAEGPSARVLSKKTPPSCTSKVLPQIEGVGTFTGNGPLAVVMEPRHNRVRYLLHGQIDNLLVRCIFRKICERRRRSNTGVTVGDLRSGFRDKPPTEAHLSGFCFNTTNHNSNVPKNQIVFMQFEIKIDHIYNLQWKYRFEGDLI